jgi:transposase
VQEHRARWREEMPLHDPARLVFIDETSTKTNMTRACGRAPVGERLVDYVPHGHWQTSTFIGARRVDGMTAPVVFDGAVNGEIFLVYVRDHLAPALKPGDIVVMDNLSSHKVEGVRQAIEAVGARIEYLPPYSPDLNPIENAFSKLKAMLKKFGERQIDALWKRIGSLIDTFTPAECRNYFRHCGYSADQL